MSEDAVDAKSVQVREGLVAALGQEHQLKKTEGTRDASAPVIESDAHIGKSPMPAVLAQVAAESHSLKKVDTSEMHDVSSPQIQSGTKIRENPMKAVLAEVPSGGAVLAHKKLNKEITGEHQLKHVEEQHDASSPVIDGEFQLREAPQKKVFADIAAGHQLKHVETTHDASAPIIEDSVRVGENPMKAVLAEVPSGTTVLAHKKINKEIVGEHQLKHVEEKRDASSPVIDGEFQLREAPQKKVFAELTSAEHALKPAGATRDASAPAIEKDTQIGKNPLPDLLKSLPAADPETGATGAQLKRVEKQ